MSDRVRGRGEPGAPPARRVADALRRALPRYFMMEKYGPDGEIVEAWESHELDPDWEGATSIVITCYSFAEPRTDWRERGVIPPQGFHRMRERH